MKLLAYCYGPVSVDKTRFTKSFLAENKDYKFIDLHKARKKITGSVIPSDKETELKLKNEIEEKCISFLIKEKPVLINGLFLNKESRINFLSSIQEKINTSFKKIAISFKTNNLTELFENNKKEKIFKDVSFDELRKQEGIFNKVSSSEEADLIIDEINFENSSCIKINTKLWGEDRIITCDNFKKLAEYFRCSTSFI
jgi:hypothetical protein